MTRRGYASTTNADIMRANPSQYRSIPWVDSKRYQGAELPKTLAQLADDDFSNLLLTESTASLFSTHFQQADRAAFLEAYTQALDSRARRMSPFQLLAAAAGLDAHNASETTPFVMQQRLEKEVYPLLSDPEKRGPHLQEARRVSALFGQDPDGATLSSLLTELPGNHERLVAAHFAADAQLDATGTAAVLGFADRLRAGEGSTASVDAPRLENAADEAAAKKMLAEMLAEEEEREKAAGGYDPVEDMLENPAGKRAKERLERNPFSQQQQAEIRQLASTLTSPVERGLRGTLEELAEGRHNPLAFAQMLGDLVDSPSMSAEGRASLQQMTEAAKQIHRLQNNPRLGDLGESALSQEDLQTMQESLDPERIWRETSMLNRLTLLPTKEFSLQLIGIPLEQRPSDEFLEAYTQLAVERVVQFDAEDISAVLSGLEHINYHPPAWMFDILANKAAEVVIAAQVASMKADGH
ncbi:MAG: hypothetical protein Q8P67_24100 [archaeon]|nr:hypothetical protein [archaeon]